MKKNLRKIREKKKSAFDFDINDINEYMRQLPEVLFLIFMIWFGYSIFSNESKNLVYQKYLKKSLIQGRKYIDNYFPGFLSSEAVFSRFDYDVLFIKTKELISVLGGFYIVGALMLLIFSSSGRKIILFITLLLDLIFVHNLIFYRDGKLFEIFAFVRNFGLSLSRICIFCFPGIFVGGLGLFGGVWQCRPHMGLVWLYSY